MRYIYPNVVKDLKHKMVFIGGPRQCGKTTLAKDIIQREYGAKAEYLNWDNDKDRKAILAQKWSDTSQLVVLDEVHKYRRWKNWLKGQYDKNHPGQNYLVTGSAKLDVYRRGGDSMLGRYHYWRLHPYTLGEIPNGISPQDAFERLMTVGGFPEVFLKNDLTFARRWRRERFDRVLREDLRDLENIRDVTLLSIFTESLQKRVSSLIVLSNLAQDLEIHPKTAKFWLELVERMYLGFAVYPFSTKGLTRAIRKPPKFYFYDNGDVEGDKGAVFENLVATHLKKQLDFIEYATGHRMELKFIRDKEKHEVDFVVLKNRKPIELIEAKWSEEQPTTSIKHFAKKLGVQKCTQIVGTLKGSFKRNGIEVIGPIEYFTGK